MGDLQGHALVGAEGNAERTKVVDVTDLLPSTHVCDNGPGRQYVSPDAARHWLGHELSAVT